MKKRATIKNPSTKEGLSRAKQPKASEANFPKKASPSAAPILSNGGAHLTADVQFDRSPVVAEIVQLWRLRQRWHRAEKSLILQAKAICRSWTEGDKDKANKLFDQFMDGEDVDDTITMALTPFHDAIAQFEHLRKALEKRLKKLAQSTPEWEWVKGVKGFGPNNLAAILGETGGILIYRNPSCLWKRMGLAVIDGGRQRKVADVDAALLHGYNPSRRAVAWNLGECLIKANGPAKAVYDQRKAIELQTEGRTPIHAHRRAARYMVKRVLRDLWRAMRDQSKAICPTPQEARWRMPSSDPDRGEADKVVSGKTKEKLPNPDTIHGEATKSMPAKARHAMPSREPTKRKAA